MLGDASRFALSLHSPLSLKILHSQVQGLRGAWNGSARTMSASTEPLNISRSRGGGGGRNRERKCRIPRISPPPLRFVLRLRLQREGRICGTLRYISPWEGGRTYWCWAVSDNATTPQEGYTTWYPLHVTCSCQQNLLTFQNPI